MVTTPTRLNPKEILDPIITTLGAWYQTPVCLAPVDADPGTGGKASDHLIPTMRPLNMINNLPARAHRKITVRPLPESCLATLENCLRQQSWARVLEATTANDMADIFQEVAMMMINKNVPEKVRMVSSDDQDWYTDGLKRLDRKRRREFHHNRRSSRYLTLSRQYQAKCKQEKHKFFKNIVRQAKESNPNNWYRLLKRISNHDSGQKKSIVIEEIFHLTDKEQVEAIASAFNAPSQRYQALQANDIEIPGFTLDTIPVYTPTQIRQTNKDKQSNDTWRYPC